MEGQRLKRFRGVRINGAILWLCVFSAVIGISCNCRKGKENVSGHPNLNKDEQKAYETVDRSNPQMVIASYIRSVKVMNKSEILKSIASDLRPICRDMLDAHTDHYRKWKELRSAIRDHYDEGLVRSFEEGPISRFRSMPKNLLSIGQSDHDKVGRVRLRRQENTILVYHDTHRSPKILTRANGLWFVSFESKDLILDSMLTCGKQLSAIKALFEKGIKGIRNGSISRKEIEAFICSGSWKITFATE